MSVPHPLPEALIELVARRLRLIGEPVRIRLLDRLRDGERSVGDLAAELGSSQQNVSKHLGILQQAGITGRRKEGNRVMYWIADASVFTLFEIISGGLHHQVAELAQILEPPTDP